MENKNLKETYYGYLRYFLAKDESTATSYDKYMALAYAVRSEMVDNWIKTQQEYHTRNLRRIYYLSMEYIFGKSLRQNMINLGIEKPLISAVNSLGFSFDELVHQEDDFELGNTGKGRIAVCYLESMATIGIPSMAYGLRYDYAQFQQSIKNGIQIERPYDWLHRGHPWEIIRPEYSCLVRFGGQCSCGGGGGPLGPAEWETQEQVHAIPYDVPVAGYNNDIVNTLRLWSARPSEEFLPDYFNHSDYIRACEEKSQYGRITKVLFPEEDVRRATELRMKQQYFFVSAALQDILRRYKVNNSNILDFDKKVVIQLNGSRCALAIPELMRLLVDVENVPWEEAWRITSNVFAYTSNAVSKDNLETWPVYKVNQIFPRHMQIIFDINQFHLDNVRRCFSNDPEMVRSLSLIEEGEVKRIRLAHLAVVGSFSVNGISRIQSDLLQKKLFPVFSQYNPQKFCNKTVGVAHRRWLLCANPELSELITSAIGDQWVTKPEKLLDLEQYADDMQFLKSLYDVKKNAKVRLSSQIRERCRFDPDETFMYDIQSGKIHPCKRHVLHIFNILHRYLLVKSGKNLESSRLHIFSGKASPSDFLAKQVIQLINVTAELVNNDPQVNDKIRVIFVPNFGMSWAEKMVPGADLSEQISTASFEAAGTFNMKYAFNGALTIASKSGSNIELAEKVGEENIFLFGKDSEFTSSIQNYHPCELLSSDQSLQNIFSLLDTYLSQIQEGSSINPLISSLRDSDRYFVLVDFNDYIKQQEQVDLLFADKMQWTRKSLLNIARVGWFSSDRVTAEYIKDIWKVPVL
ncbi:MAG: glycogen/starch/alpha-glucan phosphorylase [Fibrobacter sp.]|nr:glycogen/starch/alpha-glucan phosphorylase [Fibrobacter sp.]